MYYCCHDREEVGYWNACWISKQEGYNTPKNKVLCIPTPKIYTPGWTGVELLAEIMNTAANMDILVHKTGKTKKGRVVAIPSEFAKNVFFWVLI